MDSSIIVSHDDTALIQNAINTRTSNNLNSLRLGSKNYIISNVNLPTGFKLYGTSRRTQLKKLAWSANNQNTNKMIGTIDNAVLELISISNIDIDGNMQNQYLLDDTSDAYINYIVDIKGSNHSFDNLIISNVVGGGISSTQPVNLMITNCHIEGGGLSDRDQLSPIVADNGSSLLITNNVLKNFPGNIDVSLSNSGVLNGNIVNNCGSGILIYGSINLVTSANIILGPAGEFIPGPDILNSEFDAVNVTLTSDTDYLSDMYVYQENGSLFNLTTNSGVISYKVEKLRKVNNVEELYGEVVVQDPTTSSISLVCPLFPILNTDFLNGQFKFLITISGVNSLTNYYSYSRLHAIEPNHVGLVYKALLTEYVPSGQVTSATLFNSPPYAHIQVKIPDPQNLAVGSTVRLLGIGASPTVEDVDAIIDHADTINQLYTIKYNTTISNISNVFGSTQLTRKNTFVLVKGRIQ
jgi:hypothetical protein